MVDLNEKKQWLKWLLAYGPFQRREILWILDYLLHHDNILANIKIVEHADATTRGLVLMPNQSSENALTLYLNGHLMIQIKFSMKFALIGNNLFFWNVHYRNLGNFLNT